LEIRSKKNGKLMFSQQKDTGFLEKDSIKTLTFSLPNLENFEDGEYVIESKLMKDSKIIDSKDYSFKVNNALCASRVVEEEEKKKEIPPIIKILTVIMGIMIIILVILNVLLSREKIDIIFVKNYKDGIVKVVVINKGDKTLKNCRIIDKIPENAEISVTTFGVFRIKDRLVMNLGRLKPGEKGILEYKLKYKGILPNAVFEYDGNKIESRFVRDLSYFNI